MFCKNCGKSIGDASLFCPYCGTKVAADDLGENTAAAQEQQDNGYDQVLDYDDIEATRVLSNSHVRRDYGKYNTGDNHGPHYSGSSAGSNNQNNYSGYGQGAQNTAGYNQSNQASYGQSVYGQNYQNGQSGQNTQYGGYGSYGQNQNTEGYNGYGQSAGDYNTGAQYGGNTQSNYGQNGASGGWHSGSNPGNTGGYGQNGYYTYNTSGQSAVKAQRPKKKLGKGAIVGISVGGGVALIAVIVVCLLLFLNRSTYETPLKTMVSALNKGDVMKVIEVLPLKPIIEDGGMSEYLLGMNYDDLVNLYEDQFEDSFVDDMKDEYGRDFKIDYKIYEAEKLSKDDLTDLNSDYAYSFGTDDDFISEAMELDVDMSIEGSEGSDVENTTIVVIKIGGKWYLDMFSLD